MIDDRLLSQVNLQVKPLVSRNQCLSLSIFSKISPQNSPFIQFSIFSILQIICFYLYNISYKSKRTDLFITLWKGCGKHFKRKKIECLFLFIIFNRYFLQIYDCILSCNFNIYFKSVFNTYKLLLIYYYSLDPNFL